MDQRDFLKFAWNLEHYTTNAELEYIESGFDYPVACLDDITIYFNHAKDKESAKAEWNKRAGRIDFDNIYYIMYG